MNWNWPWKAGGAAVPERKAATGFVALHASGEAHWTRRDYTALSREGFMKNPVVHRSVRLIAETASAIPWLLYEGADELDTHPMLDLLERPNQRQAGATFLEALYGHLLLSGNAYLEMIAAAGNGGGCARTASAAAGPGVGADRRGGLADRAGVSRGERQAADCRRPGGRGLICTCRCSIRSTTTTASRRWKPR